MFARWVIKKIIVIVAKQYQKIQSIKKYSNRKYSQLSSMLKMVDLSDPTFKTSLLVDNSLGQNGSYGFQIATNID